MDHAVWINANVLVDDRSTNGGMTGSTGPSIRQITEPKCGYPSRRLIPMGKPVMLWKLECSSIYPTTERMTTSLSMIAAVLGSNSRIWTPGTRVSGRDKGCRQPSTVAQGLIPYPSPFDPVPGGTSESQVEPAEDRVRGPSCTAQGSRSLRQRLL